MEAFSINWTIDKFAYSGFVQPYVERGNIIFHITIIGMDGKPFQQPVLLFRSKDQWFQDNAGILLSDQTKLAIGEAISLHLKNAN